LRNTLPQITPHLRVGWRWPDALGAMRYPAFRWFFFGQLVSLLGSWMQTTALQWLAYRLTGSVLSLGTITFANFLPVLFLSLFMGVLVDRYPRRRLLIFTQTMFMVLAAILAYLTFTGKVTYPILVILALLTGVANALDIPARQAFFSDLVRRDDLLNAIALNSSVFNGARILGPAVAGALVASIGEGWCFFLNAVSYVAVIAGLLLMRLNAARRPAQDGSTLQNIAEGFRHVARTGPIRALMLMLGLVSLAGMPYAVLMPIFADEILHGGPQTLGLLMGASGVGALAAAGLLATQKGVAGLGRWVALSAAGFGVSLVLFAWSTSVWFSTAALVPAGFCMMLQMASSNTLIQSMVPDALRGRVMAIYSMMFMGMAPFGALLAGTLADRVGAPVTVAAGGVVCMCGAAVFGWRLPALRPEARRIIVAQQAAAGDPSQGMTGTGAEDRRASIR
jgi:MFS family permease